MSELRVSRSVVVNARPDEVFALLADPREHPNLDGSGSVRASVSGPERLSLGARFGMRMRLGLPYVISSEVVEFEADRLIAWRHAAHHIWRWQLEPVAGGTQVTETFDYAASRSPRVTQLLGFPQRNTRGIDATLAGLQQRFA